MVLFSTFALAGLATATASLTGGNTADSNESPSNVARGAFILECESSQNLDSLIKTVQEQGGQIRRQFNSKVFYGISVQLDNTTMTKNGMEQMPGVTKVWPVERKEQQVELPAVPEPENQRRDISSTWNHIMTQVDKLHAAGYTGGGIQIAVVDTGINYTHSALGGCFGKGCRVALGDNFAKDREGSDPMDCHGHGTTVAGIIAGNDANYIGVAPNATLAGYRVLDCDATMADDDDLVAGWIKAYEDGAQIIVSSTGRQGSSWATRPVAAVVSRIVDSGVPCIVGLGNKRQDGLFSVMDPSSGKGVTSVNSFARAPGALDGHVTDAPMAAFSAYGPNWDLDIKPTVGAPGDDVPCIKNDGGYGVFSGTSFAGPLVGGILALMAEVRGSFDPVLLNNLLISTAVPQGSPYSVAQQGGGLVRAWDAAHATTLVEPASLAFNDTLHRTQSLSLRITNTAKTNVTYHLDTIAADTLYTTWARSGVSEMPPVKETADIRLSQHVLVLRPGQSASVDVSATDPTGLDVHRLPVWSGWIAINSSTSFNGTNGTSLTVPYLGMAGSLKDHAVLSPYGVKLAWMEYDPQVRLVVERRHYNLSSIKYKINNDSTLGLSVPLGVAPLLGTPLVRVEVVPVLPRKWLADRLQSKNLKLDVLTLENLPHTQTTYAMWNGQLPSGDYIPAGIYKFVVRALRLFGDPDTESDWDLAESVWFQIMIGPGKKACEIYKSGQAIPADALFNSYEECLLVHGDVLVDIPWIPEPKDAAVSALCTKDSPTEKYCGTYQFCKAHAAAPDPLPGLKSPFQWDWECFRSHKMLPWLWKNLGGVEECETTKDEGICGTEIWCDKFGVATLFSSVEECKAAHGRFW